MASSQPMKKNTATTVVFPILDADGDLVTGATALDSEYSLDGAGFLDCASEAAEIGATGIYSLALAAGETNADVVCIQIKTTTVGAKTTPLVFYTAAQTLDDIEALVDDIGVAGAGLTAIPWNAAWDAEVESEATDALNAYDPPTNAEMVARTLATASYALEATLTSITALVDDLEGRLTAARAGYLDELAAANVPSDIDTLLARLTALRAGYLDNLSAGAVALEATVTSLLPAALVGGRMDSDIGAKTGNVALSAQEKLDVNAEMDTALNTAIPALPTADSVNQRLVAVDDLTQAAGAGDLAAVLGDTAELQGDWVNGGRLDLLIDQIISDIAALNDVSAAAVNAEMLDVLNTDTFAEPTGVPAATASLVAKLGVLYMMARNRIDVTASKKTIYGDDDAAEFEKDLTDDGATYSESETNAI